VLLSQLAVMRFRVIAALIFCLISFSPSPARSQNITPTRDTEQGGGVRQLHVTVLRRIPCGTTPFDIIWSGDSSRVAAYSNRGHRINVWDREGHLLSELSRSRRLIFGHGLGFLDRGGELVTAPATIESTNSLLSIFDLATGAVVRDLPGPKPGEKLGNEALEIAVSPDESTIAAVTGGPPSGVEPVRLYTALDFNLTKILTDSVHNRTTTRREDRDVPAKRLAFSANSRILAVGRADGTIAIYDVASGKLMQNIDGFLKYLTSITSLAVSPDGQFVAAGTGMAFETWRYPNGRLAPIGEGQLMTLRAPDPIRVYSVRDAKLVASYTGPLQPIFGLAWSPTGHIIAFIGNDQNLHLWDVRHANEPGLIIPLGQDATSVNFAPDDTRFATGDGGNLTLYRIEEAP
jgi:WD40 repeat protein